ncbi:hypothetical protein [Flavihumibacter fluvii]|uniref:hypothetical protein n=1 Tax=Flavihumibacter fluvii TaxID=2838157 RepID=UPI001BDEC7B2|nr:hypothetical protein [Flavihumibacter fluvii]ULQ53345.1 hypothetical protein KJS93_03315 [Flavihumibacter fluvii]
MYAIMNPKVQVLLKFGELPHISELLQFGNVFINPLSYFKKSINHGRFDKTEGRFSLTHLDSPKLELRLNENSEWRPINVLTAQLNEFGNDERIKSYSLFYITEEETKNNIPFELSLEMKKMGDYFLLITNPNEFMKRIEAHLNALGLNFNYSTVNYYDPTVNHQNLGFFDKPQQFDYQKEFRIIVESKVPGPLEFSIGSLRDIAELMNSQNCQGFNFSWR